MGTDGMEMFARCGRGFEQVLAQELRGLGMRRVRPLVGAVSFTGGLRDAYRACLWSRVATRVQVVVGRVRATDADAFYEGVRGIAWEGVVRRGATVAVRAHGTNAALRNTQFTALKAKDALCDRLRERWGDRPDVDAHDPDASIDVALHEARATVCLNVSGSSLHRRGYREDGVQTAAPLKETLAAGMLLAAGWDKLAKDGGVLVDPMCGSGTIAVEAALIACDLAPGLLRSRWGFEGWSSHDEAVWQEVLSDAVSRAEAGRACAASSLCVLAGDADKDALAVARDNVRRAGVASCVQLFVDDAARLGRHLRGVAKRGIRDGMLVTNPPYGERLGSRDDLPATNAALAEAVQALPRGWQVAILTPDVGVDSALGRVPSHVLACNNGPIDVCVRHYDTQAERRVLEVTSLAGRQRQVPIADAHSPQFAARLRKVAREQTRRTRREDVAGLRVYDGELPEFRLCVDAYDGAGRDEGVRYAVVEERRRPARVDDDDATRRLADARAIVSAVLEVPPANVLVRPWRRGDGTGRDHARREAGGHQAVMLEVCEDGLSFRIDLAGRPDTGLSPALRDVRRRVGGLAANRDVLCLGDAVMACAVHAAGVGARRTTSVVEYPDRADWLRDSLRRNGFADKGHRVECSDVAAWVRRAVGDGRTFDVVICCGDVPHASELLGAGGQLVTP